MWAVLQHKLANPLATMASPSARPPADGVTPPASSRRDAGFLLQRHVEGDPGAFGELVSEYRAPVYGYLVRCGIHAEDRDDLFQDIFVKVHRAAASYQPSRPLHPWLFTIVCNTVRTYLRRRKVQHQVFRQPDATTPEPADEGADGERHAAAKQRLNQLEGELEGLSPVQRQVLLLAGVEKLPLKEVATMLRLPVNTVKTHLRRARLALAKALARRESEGLTSSGSTTGQDGGTP